MVFIQKILTEVPQCEAFLEKLMVTQLVKKFPTFKEHEGLLPCSQMSTSENYSLEISHFWALKLSPRPICFHERVIQCLQTLINLFFFLLLSLDFLQ